ncbi:MAG: hypothetical protein ACUVTR_00435 [Dehalococcoidia bacterium]
MAKSQENNTIMLLGLKDCKAFHTWTNGTKVYLDLHGQRRRHRGCSHTLTEGKELALAAPG